MYRCIDVANRAWRILNRIKILSLMLLSPLAVLAADAPRHVHYDAPEQFRAPGPDGTLAPRLENLGVHKFPAAKASRVGQLFMNQGINLTYGFNHVEAGRAFAEAARLDPNNALALWGQALVLGPNINLPMDPASEPIARDLIDRALKLVDAEGATDEKARLYVHALSNRYTGRAEDRAAADRAYADAMRDLAHRLPKDLDAQALFAESLMDLRPWDYWQGDGTPYPETKEIEKTLRAVISRNKNHPGALHYWIHLWEATSTPQEAEDESDRLVNLLPAAGHLVHMPGHIYARIGRYADAISVNQKAVLADEDYISQCRAQGFYPLAYYPHNVHFIWLGASFSGQSQLAIEAADKTANLIPEEALQQMPLLQSFKVVPIFARIQFHHWADILAETKPKYSLKFYSGIWHFARGLAQLGDIDPAQSAPFPRDSERLKGAQQELGALEAILDDPTLATEAASPSRNSGTDVLRIARLVLAGEIAHARGDAEDAIAMLDRGARLEDALIYNEPPDWPQPVRQRLGQALLDFKRPHEAEAVYWEDLKRNRENGWALRGLYAALRAQDKTDTAAIVLQRWTKAFAAADPELRPPASASR